MSKTKDGGWILDDSSLLPYKVKEKDEKDNIQKHKENEETKKSDEKKSPTLS